MSFRDELEQAETLPRAITLLRENAGSHDKLAAELGTSRQRVIAWEKGGYPREYVDALKTMGVPERLLDRDSRVSTDDRLGELEGEVADLTTALAAARQANERIVRRLAKLERAVAPLLAGEQERGSTRRVQPAR